MFYRYEAKRPYEKDYIGLCHALTPDHRRKIARFLKVPKWYETHPGIKSECWFTEYGYEKYHQKINKIIKDCNDYYYPIEIRVIRKKELDNITMRGRVQCICLTDEKNKDQMSSCREPS